MGEALRTAAAVNAQIRRFMASRQGRPLSQAERVELAGLYGDYRVLLDVEAAWRGLVPAA